MYELNLKKKKKNVNLWLFEIDRPAVCLSHKSPIFGWLV
jgi:hypothetical protein